jgi:hypothetical protein
MLVQAHLPQRLVIDAVIKEAVCTQRNLRTHLSGTDGQPDPVHAYTPDAVGLFDWETGQLAVIMTYESRLARDGPAAAYDAFAAEWQTRFPEEGKASLLDAMVTGGIGVHFELLEQRRRGFVAFTRVAPTPSIRETCELPTPRVAELLAAVAPTTNHAL